MCQVNKAILQRKPDGRSKVAFLHNTATAHMTKTVKVALQAFEWGVSFKLLYFPDIAPIDTTFPDHSQMKFVAVLLTAKRCQNLIGRISNLNISNEKQSIN